MRDEYQQQDESDGDRQNTSGRNGRRATAAPAPLLPPLGSPGGLGRVRVAARASGEGCRAGRRPAARRAYRVDEEVPTDGFLAAFTIRSDFGTVVARGPGVLGIRVAEVNALAQLETMAADDVFVDALKQSASSLGDAVVHVVTNPVEVAKAVPGRRRAFLWTRHPECEDGNPEAG